MSKTINLTPAEKAQYEKNLREVDQLVRDLSAELKRFKANPGTWNVMLYYLKGKGFRMKDVVDIVAGVDEFMSNYLPEKK